MTILPSPLGPYTIDREIGRGGMGVVYLGHDTKLDRPVAIKALPEQLAQDPERLARFEREARTLAQLNHPNVAGIYGVEEHAGARYLILEYVEGQTLGQRLDRGPLAVEEALDLAIQIASGMEAAHEAGVIHRDLKPGNVVVTPDRKAKILDFGLARAERLSESTYSELVTATSPAPVTREGVALGTPAYMSPEQTSGRSIDRRSDIWAFGCVLYEMLTGRRAFEGKSSAEIASAILRDQPDLGRLPPQAPAMLARLLGRCFAKDPQRRLRDIGDVRLELEEALSLVSSSPDGAQLWQGVGPRPARRRGRNALAMVGIGAAVGGAIVGAMVLKTGGGRPGPGPSHLSIVMPFAPSDRSYFVPTFAASRDGRQLLFVSAGEGDGRRLFVRGLDASVPRELTEAKGLLEIAAFSPNGDWIVYSDEDGWIKRISVEGGPPENVCRAMRVPGIIWTRDDRIIFGSHDDGLMLEAPARGGEAKVLDIPLEDGARAKWPELVREESALVYSCDRQVGTSREQWVEVFDFKTGRIKRLIDDATYPRFVAGGHLLFQRGSTLMAAPFDEGRLEVTGSALPMLETMPMPFIGAAAWDVSDDGTLFYIADRAQAETALVRIERAGEAEPLTSHRLFLLHLLQRIRLDPAGKRIAIVRVKEALDGEIWIVDIERDVLMPLPLAEGSQTSPVWSADGQWIYFSQFTTGTIESDGLFRRRSDGTGEPELVLDNPRGIRCDDMSRDGRMLLVSVNDGPTAEEIGRDVGVIDLTQMEPVVQLLTRGGNDEWGGRFSPDGEWVAYVSDESGIEQVYVRPTLSEAGRVQVSRDGGVSPVWAPDGSEIYFGDPVASLVMVASVGTPALSASTGSDEAHVTIGAPRALFPARSPRFIEDVFPGGEQFLMVDAVSDAGAQSTKIDVILNFFDLLREN